MVFETCLNMSVEKIINAPYPFDVVDANKSKARKKFGDKLIDFGVGDPTDPTPELVREKAKQAVDSRASSGYPSTCGISELKESISGWMKRRFSSSFSSDDVLPLYGAKYAVFHMPFHFVNPCSEDFVLIPNPGYPPYTDGSVIAGASVHYLNMLEENDFLPDLSSVPAYTAKNSKILFINSPHSPTGKAYSKEFLKQAVDFCNDNNIVLVSDECYSEIYFGKKPVSVSSVNGSKDCAIIVNSLSKRSRMTGYAVGFAASKNPELLKPLASVQSKSIQGIPDFLQDAAVAAFNDDSHVLEMNKLYNERLEVLLPALKSAGCNVRKPDGTFYLWAGVPKNETALSFSEKLLLEKGINCVPGSLISTEFEGINPGEGFVRFALVPSLEKTKDAAKRLGE